MSKIWFTSDLHLFHKNIITYCKRPFSNTEEMNLKIINNWNYKVAEDDVVYIIGDIAFKGKTIVKEILNKLNGTKILIRGNHDRKDNIPDDCFLEVVKRKQIVGEGYDFILVHDPAEASANHTNNQKYLCGHLHSEPERRIYKNWVDIGVDGNNFYPISLDEVIKIFKDEAEKKLGVNELLQCRTSDSNNIK
jgi:calcineurin-like phosphoesterase family protein